MQFRDGGNPWPGTPYFNSEFQPTKPDLGHTFETYITMALNERVYLLQCRINVLETELMQAKVQMNHLAKPWWKRWLGR